MLEHDNQHINRRYKNLSRVALLVYLALMLVSVFLIHFDVRDSARADPSPVEFVGRLLPDKAVYRPGEVVRFRYTAHTKQNRLMLAMVDSFEGVQTQEVYPASNVMRAFDKAGEYTVVAARVLPTGIHPGVYRLRGLAKADTQIRTLPAYYESDPFRVIGGE